MHYAFKLPDIGEGVAEGEIVQWLVTPGDWVEEDQTLVEVMTDKVTAEIPSPMRGRVVSLHAKPGERLPVGQVLVTLDTEAAVSESTSAAEPAPSLTLQVTSSACAANAQPEATVKTAAETAQSHLPAEPEPALPSRPLGRVLATPATRRLAHDLGVEIQQVSGTGPNGRVTQEDVRHWAANHLVEVTPISLDPVPSETDPSDAVLERLQLPQSVAHSIGSEVVLADADAASEDTADSPVLRAPLVDANGEQRVPFSGVRRRIAEHLTEVKQRVPHFAYVEEVDVTDLVNLRQQLKPLVKAEGIPLTYLPFMMKAVVSGLKAYPAFNSSYDERQQELVLKHHYHLGVAVETEQGLLVPVLHDVDQKPIRQLAIELRDLSERARTGRLTLEDTRGGTFTISSIGSIGGMIGIPIINHPEVAILAVNKIAKRPAVVNDAIAIRQMLYLTLAADHRVIDGAVAARFMNHVKDVLEAPAQLLWA
ncbi:MAG: dihydrolipoamide acetyltransferase family protein [Candidatus Melainabacteria bacterium]|nr:dihydrolipoamide acetyltransferase family protein [Candidatus Melainabacteria bacterium]